MHEHHRAFIRRALIIPAAIAATLAVGSHALGSANWQAAPDLRPGPSSASATPDPIVAAEAEVRAKLAALTEGLECYTDPTGHHPTLAVVKLDGTTAVRTVTAEQAWTSAHAGEVWVLAWCDGSRSDIRG